MHVTQIKTILLEHDPIPAIEWFESNYIKLNQDKFHFLLSGHKHEVMFAKIFKSQQNGISRNLLDILRNFLNNRKQRVALYG